MPRHAVAFSPLMIFITTFSSLRLFSPDAIAFAVARRFDDELPLISSYLLSFLI